MVITLETPAHIAEMAPIAEEVALKGHARSLRVRIPVEAVGTTAVPVLRGAMEITEALAHPEVVVVVLIAAHEVLHDLPEVTEVAVAADDLQEEAIAVAEGEVIPPEA